MCDLIYMRNISTRAHVIHGHEYESLVFLRDYREDRIIAREKATRVSILAYEYDFGRPNVVPRNNSWMQHGGIRRIHFNQITYAPNCENRVLCVHARAIIREILASLPSTPLDPTSKPLYFLSAVILDKLLDFAKGLLH